MRYGIIMILALILMTGCSTEAVELQETAQAEKVVDIDCPRGIVHEEYPGSCYLYEDKDNNHICDLSE